MRRRAAYAAYQRAATPADEAAALALWAEVYAGREDWRPALNAYRASLAARRGAARSRQTYEELREKHGFRILNYTVDSDSASPRACFQFSEPLAAGKVDFAPFVAVSGAANAAVTAEGDQLCVDGLKHGERYAIVLRQGLPSSVGESLLKSADYEVYVRDRSPQVALHRPQLRPAAHRPGGHPGRLGQHEPGRDRRLPHRRPQPPADACARTIS